MKATLKKKKKLSSIYAMTYILVANERCEFRMTNFLLVCIYFGLGLLKNVTLSAKLVYNHNNQKYPTCI